MAGVVLLQDGPIKTFSCGLLVVANDHALLQILDEVLDLNISLLEEVWHCHMRIFLTFFPQPRIFLLAFWECRDDTLSFWHDGWLSESRGGVFVGEVLIFRFLVQSVVGGFIVDVAFLIRFWHLLPLGGRFLVLHLFVSLDAVAEDLNFSLHEFLLAQTQFVEILDFYFLW